MLNYTIGKGKKSQVIATWLEPKIYVERFEDFVKNCSLHLNLSKVRGWQNGPASGYNPYKDDVTAEHFATFQCAMNFGRQFANEFEVFTDNLP